MFTNVRTCIASADWDRLRRMVYARVGQRCELCGRGPDAAARRRLEAHERWVFDEPVGVQRLARLVCCCSDCHAVTHFGLTALRGGEERALAHLQTVTGLDRGQALAHVDAAFAVWQQRSRRVWALDLAMLTSAGIRLADPPAPEVRAAQAARKAAGQPAAGT